MLGFQTEFLMVKGFKKILLQHWCADLEDNMLICLVHDSAIMDSQMKLSIPNNDFMQLLPIERAQLVHDDSIHVIPNTSLHEYQNILELSLNSGCLSVRVLHNQEIITVSGVVVIARVSHVL